MPDADAVYYDHGGSYEFAFRPHLAAAAARARGEARSVGALNAHLGPGDRVVTEIGSVEFRSGYMVVTPAPEGSVGLAGGRILAKLKHERYGDAPVYIIYHNLHGVRADYAFMSRADHFCSENSIPLIVVVDPSHRALANIAIARLFAKTHCFRTEPSLEAAIAYVESHRL